MKIEVVRITGASTSRLIQTIKKAHFSICAFFDSIR